MRALFEEIFLFLFAALITVAAPLLPQKIQRVAAVILAGLLFFVAFLWAVIELRRSPTGRRVLNAGQLCLAILSLLGIGYLLGRSQQAPPNQISKVVLGPAPPASVPGNAVSSSPGPSHPVTPQLPLEKT